MGFRSRKSGRGSRGQRPWKKILKPHSYVRVYFKIPHLAKFSNLKFYFFLGPCFNREIYLGWHMTEKSHFSGNTLTEKLFLGCSYDREIFFSGDTITEKLLSRLKLQPRNITSTFQRRNFYLGHPFIRNPFFSGNTPSEIFLSRATLHPRNSFLGQHLYREISFSRSLC